TTRLDSANAVGLERLVADEKLAVLLGEDVVRHRGDAQARAQATAKLEHQRSLAAADGSTNSNGKGAGGGIAVEPQLALMEVSGVMKVLVCMAVMVVHGGVQV